MLAILSCVSLAVPAAASDKDGAPPEFVALNDVDPTIRYDIRYFGQHNFVGERIDGYRQPQCILTRQAATALRTAQRTLLRQGYTLKVYDCYRPQRAVDDFVAWGKRLRDQRMKAEFYPRVDKRRVFKEGYIAEQSGHSRGSTVDVTLVKRPPGPQDRYRRGDRLVDCAAPRSQRFRDNSIDMGTGYDCFDPLSHPYNARVRGKQRANRLKLRRALLAQGFKGLATEWWHFTLREEPYPETFFDFPVSRAALGG